MVWQDVLRHIASTACFAASFGALDWTPNADKYRFDPTTVRRTAIDEPVRTETVMKKGLSMQTLKPSRRTVGLGIAVGTLSLTYPVLAETALKPGQPAPQFMARDAGGRDVTLASFKGKVVVLEWTNHDCPYVKKHYGAGNMQALQAEAAAQDVVWLTISSSAPGGQGHVNGLEAEKLTTDRKAQPTAFLLDHAGHIGRLYHATATPHMYIIDKAGVLVYMGAIDDKPTTNRDDIAGARNYVKEALAALASGQPVKTASTRVYGCSIKYQDPRS